MKLYLATIIGMLVCLVSCKKETIIISSPSDTGVITVPGSADLHAFDITLISRTTTTAQIQWSYAGDYQSDSVTYVLSLNGEQLASNIKANSYIFTNLQPITNYHLEIKAVVSSTKYMVSVLDFITDDGYTKFQQSMYTNVYPYDIAIAPQNGYLISLINLSRSGMLLSRVDSLGNEIWRKTYSYDGSGTKIKRVSDGYVIVGGKYVLKVDFEGNEVWYTPFEGNGWFTAITEAANGDFLLAGSDNYYDSTITSKALLVRLTASGNVLWKKTYGETLRNHGVDVVPADNGSGFYVLGSKYYNSDVYLENEQYWLFKTDNSGNMIWEKVFGDEITDYPVQLRKVNNDLIAGGYTSTDVQGQRQMLIYRLNQNGEVLKRIPVKDPGFDNFLNAVEITNDNGYIVSGTNSGETFGINLNLFRYDAADNLLWKKSFVYNHDVSYSNSAKAVKQTADDGFIVPATRWQVYGDKNNLWLLKLNPTGSYE
jgi:hypothetical protein